MTLGHIVDRSDASQKKTVDEVLCVYMKAPYTYTREDVVEINCHGGYLSLRKTLELVLKNGARLAERGEYTKRAFLNGRIDLSQAEAVMDIITAKTGKSHELSQRQLEGKLSGKLTEIRHAVTADLARITVAAPVTISPPANTPSFVVAPLSSSAMILPRFVVSMPGVVEATIGFGPVPIDMMTVSTARLNSDPATGTGRRRPDGRPHLAGRGHLARPRRGRRPLAAADAARGAMTTNSTEQEKTI